MLQRKSNRYLQQPFPENLVPSKPLGKRERFRPRSRTLFKNYSIMEEEMCHQWIFFWNGQAMQGSTHTHNILAKVRENAGHITLGTVSGGKSALWQQPLEQRCQTPPGKSIISPANHILKLAVNRAVGGKIVQHLNESVTTKQRKHMTVCLGFATGSASKMQAKADDSGRGVNKKVLPSDPMYFTQGTNTPSEGTALSRINMSLIPYQIRVQGKGMSAAEYVGAQIKGGFWKSIYSIHERAKLGKREIRISDDYKNRLAERRKVSILYGNLSKRTLSRAMDKAKGQGGDLESSFFSLLESRLDAALKRAFFFPTIESARHWIHRGKILVNGHACTVPGFLLQPADIFSITPPAQPLWRKEWLQFFNFANNFFGVGKEKKVRDFTKGDISMASSLLRSQKIRRFPYSPRFMQKWNSWSVIWGNSPHYKRPVNRKHRWLEKKRLEKPFSQTLHFFFATNSAFASYFQQNAGTDFTGLSRAEKTIPFIGMSMREKDIPLKVIDFSHLMDRHETRISRWMERKKPLATPARESKRYSFFTKWIDQGKWAQQEQACVVDGLYPYRWNRIFAQKKSNWERALSRRWSNIKPLHLECSYKNCSAIFLYSPQKLVWPNSINVFILRKALARSA